MSNGSMVDSKANFHLIGLNEKPETRIEVEKVPAVKEAILEILNQDKDFWNSAGRQQFGVERGILLRKVCARVPINSNVFDIALYELECEQTVLPFSDGQLTRYVMFEISR